MDYEVHHTVAAVKFLVRAENELGKVWLGTLAAPASKVEKGVLLSYRRQPGMRCLLGAPIAASSPSWCHHIWMLSPDSISDTYGSIKGKNMEGHANELPIQMWVDFMSLAWQCQEIQK